MNPAPETIDRSILPERIRNGIERLSLDITTPYGITKLMSLVVLPGLEDHCLDYYHVPAQGEDMMLQPQTKILRYSLEQGFFRRDILNAVFEQISTYHPANFLFAQAITAPQTSRLQEQIVRIKTDLGYASPDRALADKKYSQIEIDLEERNIVRTIRSSEIGVSAPTSFAGAYIITNVGTKRQEEHLLLINNTPSR